VGCNHGNNVQTSQGRRSEERISRQDCLQSRVQRFYPTVAEHLSWTSWIWLTNFTLLWFRYKNWTLQSGTNFILNLWLRVWVEHYTLDLPFLFFCVCVIEHYKVDSQASSFCGKLNNQNWTYLHPFVVESLKLKINNWTYQLHPKSVAESLKLSITHRTYHFVTHPSVSSWTLQSGLTNLILLYLSLSWTLQIGLTYLLSFSGWEFRACCVFKGF
jgi:hypothetical protein